MEATTLFAQTNNCSYKDVYRVIKTEIKQLSPFNYSERISERACTLRQARKQKWPYNPSILVVKKDILGFMELTLLGMPNIKQHLVISFLKTPGRLTLWRQKDMAIILLLKINWTVWSKTSFTTCLYSIVCIGCLKHPMHTIVFKGSDWLSTLAFFFIQSILVAKY